MPECSCCGGHCATESPGQDRGYGFCDPCVQWIEERNNRDLDRLAGKIERALNPKNRARFAAMPADERRILALKAIDDGLVTFSIAGRD